MLVVALGALIERIERHVDAPLSRLISELDAIAPDAPRRRDARIDAAPRGKHSS